MRKREQIFLFILNISSTPPLIIIPQNDFPKSKISLSLLNSQKLLSMALRNIENALPISQERPKKLAKLAKQPEIGLNDENNPVVVPESTVEYVASENLEPFADPDPEASVQV